MVPFARKGLPSGSRKIGKPSSPTPPASGRRSCFGRLNNESSLNIEAARIIPKITQIRTTRGVPMEAVSVICRLTPNNRFSVRILDNPQNYSGSLAYLSTSLKKFLQFPALPESCLRPVLSSLGQQFAEWKNKKVSLLSFCFAWMLLATE